MSAQHQCLAIAAMLALWSRDSRADPRAAVPTADFLNSIGVVSTFPDRGQPLAKTVDMVRYCGFRWVRAGIEGLSDNGPTTMQTFLELHRQTAARLSWGLVSGGSDLKRLIETGKVLAQADALLALRATTSQTTGRLSIKARKAAGAGTPGWRSRNCSETFTTRSRRIRRWRSTPCGRFRNRERKMTTLASSFLQFLRTLKP